MSDHGPIDRLWIAATELELARAPGPRGPLNPDAWPWIQVESTGFLATGCGPTLAAAALAWFLGKHSVKEIIGIGIAGCYPGSPCEVGHAYRIVSDVQVDLGAEHGDGSIRALPFPGLEGRSLELGCPVDLAGLAPASAQTVAFATGTGRTSLRRRRMAGVDLESMEGAAWAEVASRFGIPFAQVRAVSNLAGFRDVSTWRIPEALDALQSSLSKDPR